MGGRRRPPPFTPGSGSAGQSSKGQKVKMGGGYFAFRSQADSHRSIGHGGRCDRCGLSWHVGDVGVKSDVTAAPVPPATMTDSSISSGDAERKARYMTHHWAWIMFKEHFCDVTKSFDN